MNDPEAVLSAARAEPECDICGHATMTEPYLEVSLLCVYSAYVFVCTHCGFKQIRPRLTSRELAELYPTSYFDSRSEIGFGNYARQQQVQEREAFFLAKELRKVAPTGKFLEVGCALGFLLDALRRFCDWDCAGLDLSGFATYYAGTVLGVTVHGGTLEEARFADNAFDYVLQKDLLEHVRSPREHLLETHRVLRTGGYLKIVTPNGLANLNPLQAAAAREPATGGGPRGTLPLLSQGHLSFFGRRHLMRLFDECGFTVERFRNINVRRGLRALGYLPQKRKKRIPLVDRPPPRNYPGKGSEATGAEGQQRPGENTTQSFAELAERLQKEIESKSKRTRAFKPYFYYRQFRKRMDALPPALTFGFDPGLDFEFILKRK